jgi:hypothetical protein
MQVDDREAAGPLSSDLIAFFAKPVQAKGQFQDLFGRVRRSFVVDMHGTWEGEAFRLQEDFVYDDGEIEQRIWTLQPGPAGAMTATCADVVGDAKIWTAGPTLKMAYRFKLPIGKSTYALDFDDRFERLDETTAISFATVTKWGIRLGTVSIVYQRETAAQTNTAPARVAAE